MTDLDPAIWENETLGAAAPNVSLPQVEAQAIEDRNARVEGREPRLVVREGNYPKMTPSGSVPSSVSDEDNLRFAEASPDSDSDVEDEFKFDYEDDPLKEQ